MDVDILHPKFEVDPKYLKQIPAVGDFNITLTCFACRTCDRQMTVFEYRSLQCLKCKDEINKKRKSNKIMKEAI